MGKTLGAIGIGLGLAVGLGAGLYHRFVRRPLPELSGTVLLPGLSAPVEVLWDAWGVPHVYAQTSSDLFFIQGYLHAQDRLWQLDLNRHVGAGRLSELFGERTVDMDRFLRRVGLRRAAIEESKLLEDEAADAQSSYCSGINAYLQSHADRLPLEFTLLRYQPEPWTPVDALQWAKLMAWSLSLNWDMELFRAQAMTVLGAEKLAMLERPYPVGHPLTVPPGETEPLSDDKMRPIWQEVAGILGGGMSNGWVVDGARTLTGKPILANDPHLFPQLPSAWYEMHLESPDIRVTGASLPGCPGIVIGHNEHVAWGITAGMVDTQDIYVEKFTDGSHTQYQSENGPLDAAIIREPIRVKGRAEPIIEDVVTTRHGPIVLWNTNNPSQGNALRSTILEPSKITKAGISLLKAVDWTSFREALADWATPALNMVYADVDGNIGYQMVGLLPRRKPGTGYSTLRGWTGEHEWDGFLSLDDAPHTYNPSAHFVQSSNNKPVADSTVPIVGEWVDGYRGRRIESMLAAKERLGVDDMKTMHMDAYSLPAETVRRLLADIELRSPWACWAQDQLKQWDGRMLPDSRGAALYQSFRQQLFRRLLKPILGEHLETYLSATIHPLASTSTIAVRGTSLFLERMEDLVAGRLAKEMGDASEVIAESLDEAVNELRRRLGKGTAKWMWGNLHKVTFKHTLGQSGFLARIFNRGPLPLRGDGDTIHQAAFSVRDPFAASRWMPSLRFIANTSDWDKSLSMHAPGQSGQLTSPHYDDLLQLWRRGDYHPMPFSRGAVEELATSRQKFLPRA